MEIEPIKNVLQSNATASSAIRDGPTSSPALNAQKMPLAMLVWIRSVISTFRLCFK